MEWLWLYISVADSVISPWKIMRWEFIPSNKFLRWHTVFLVYFLPCQCTVYLQVSKSPLVLWRQSNRNATAVPDDVRHCRKNGGENFTCNSSDLCLRERRCRACPHRLLSSKCLHVPQRYFVVALNWRNDTRLWRRIHQQTPDTRPYMQQTTSINLVDSDLQ